MNNAIILQCLFLSEVSFSFIPTTNKTQINTIHNITHLPKEKVAQSVLARGADQDVRICKRQDIQQSYPMKKMKKKNSPNHSQNMLFIGTVILNTIIMLCRTRSTSFYHNTPHNHTYLSVRPLTNFCQTFLP